MAGFLGAIVALFISGITFQQKLLGWLAVIFFILIFFLLVYLYEKFYAFCLYIAVDLAGGRASKQKAADLNIYLLAHQHVLIACFSPIATLLGLLNIPEIIEICVGLAIWIRLSYVWHKAVNKVTGASVWFTGILFNIISIFFLILITLVLSVIAAAIMFLLLYLDIINLP